MEYNNDILGGLGFGIYQKDSKGNLILLTFTTDKSYVYNGSADATLVVRAEYKAKNFKNNASDGVEIKVSGNQFIGDDVITGDGETGEEPSDLVVTLSGSSEVDAFIGQYEEKGIDSIRRNGIRYTSSSADITYYLGEQVYSSLTALQSAVNEITTPSEITIKYVVKLKNSTATVTRKVRLK